jgi:hypothetical protein
MFNITEKKEQKVDQITEKGSRWLKRSLGTSALVIGAGALLNISVSDGVGLVILSFLAAYIYTGKKEAAAEE